MPQRCACVITGANLMSACATVAAEAPVSGTTLSFGEYRECTLSLLKERRVFQQEEQAFKLAGNAPKEWFESGGLRPVQTSVRYMNTPTNGFVQSYHSSRLARRLLASSPYNKPVFKTVAEHDSVLDTGYLLNVFLTRFTHSSSRLAWYGSQSLTPTNDARVIVREDHFPERGTSQFSHMGLLFSPSNPVYGEDGQRFCWNGRSDLETQACESGAPYGMPTGDTGREEKSMCV